MRLVTFASAIAFGLVAGLSQAGDWNGVQVAMLDRSGPYNAPQNPLAASKTWRVSQRLEADAIPLASPALLADSGMTLAITDPAGFWGWGLDSKPINKHSANDLSLRSKFQNGFGRILGDRTGNYIMNVSFRF